MYIPLCDQLLHLVVSGFIWVGGSAIFGSMNPVSPCSLITASLLAEPRDESERGD